MDMSEAREGDNSKQSTSGVHKIQPPRNSKYSTSRKRKASMLRDFFEPNRKDRDERDERQAKMEAETSIEIAQIYAGAMRHINERNQNLLS